MSNLPRVHKLIQKLCVVKSDSKISVREISVNLPGDEEEVKVLLKQLGALNYVQVSKCGQFVMLTETGKRTRIPFPSNNMKKENACNS